MTAAAVAGVLLAGTAAVAANLGILNAADSSAIGDLTATDELLPADSTATTTIATTTSTMFAETSGAETAAQQYDIAGTGTVWVATTRSGVALDHVVAETGWTPMLTQADLRSLRVDFVNGDRTVVFTASLGDDGLVVVDVTEPTTVVAATPVAPAATSATPVPTTVSGDHDDDDHDAGDDHDDDDHEYEGADDDD